MMLLPSGGAVATALLGCCGLLFPRAVARFMSFVIDGSRTGHNLIGLGVEVGIGLAMVAARL